MSKPNRQTMLEPPSMEYFIEEERRTGVAGEKREAVVKLPIPIELEERIRRLADKEIRTVPNMIHVLLESHPLLIDANQKTSTASVK